jgi:hypothetical protein
MSAAPPVLRHLVICEDIRSDVALQRQVTLVNVISSVSSTATPPYPVRQPELCAFVQMTECRGTAHCQVRIVSAVAEELIFETQTHEIVFGNNPLEVVGLSFRIRNCLFQTRGHYWLQFWYNAVMLFQQPFEMR